MLFNLTDFNFQSINAEDDAARDDGGVEGVSALTKG